MTLVEMYIMNKSFLRAQGQLSAPTQPQDY